MNRLVYLAVAGIVVSQLQGCAAAVVGGAAATGTAVALDRRTAGTFVGDQEIELRARSRLSEAFPSNPGKISPTSYNRQVLLTGQVPDEAMRTRAGEVVKGVPDVRAVYNELTIGSPLLLSAEANDAAVTSKVKARLLRDERVPGTKVKVLTENTVVYLMGLLTQEEAAIATDIGRTTNGVSKVVILFEYIN